MKYFKLSEQDLQKIGSILGEIPSKYVMQLLGILNSLTEIEESITIDSEVN